VTPDTLRLVCAAVRDGPIHIHAAEQAKEVEASLTALGERPVRWLLDHVGLDDRWCVVHATHTTEDELKDLAASAAVVGLCPVTEASLGDGIFDAVTFLAAEGRFGIGTDSNIQIDAAAELRQLEYGQRLNRLARNVLAVHQCQSTARRLVEAALAGGTQALQRPIGALAAGLRADIVVLDADHPDLAGRAADQWLDGWMFVAGRAAVRIVFAGGEAVVEAGRHRLRSGIEARYKRTVVKLAAI
jgi:formiminoglutamate deiminase